MTSARSPCSSRLRPARRVRRRSARRRPRRGRWRRGTRRAPPAGRCPTPCVSVPGDERGEHHRHDGERDHADERAGRVRRRAPLIGAPVAVLPGQPPVARAVAGVVRVEEGELHQRALHHDLAVVDAVGAVVQQRRQLAQQLLEGRVPCRRTRRRVRPGSPGTRCDEVALVVVRNPCSPRPTGRCRTSSGPGSAAPSRRWCGRAAACCAAPRHQVRLDVRQRLGRRSRAGEVVVEGVAVLEHRAEVRVGPLDEPGRRRRRCRRATSASAEVVASRRARVDRAQDPLTGGERRP